MAIEMPRMGCTVLYIQHSPGVMCIACTCRVSKSTIFKKKGIFLSVLASRKVFNTNCSILEQKAYEILIHVYSVCFGSVRMVSLFRVDMFQKSVIMAAYSNVFDWAPRPLPGPPPRSNYDFIPNGNSHNSTAHQHDWNKWCPKWSEQICPVIRAKTPFT